MSDLLNALANYSENDPPTERFESTGQLIREAHAEILRLRAENVTARAEADALQKFIDRHWLTIQRFGSRGEA